MQIEPASFFIQIHPGLENLLETELIQKLGPLYDQKNSKKISGGIELSLPLEAGFALNNILRSPTRILLRLKTFKCRDFPKLFHHIERIPWHLYLRGHLPEVEASSKTSRLIHTGRIAKTVQDGIKRSFEKRPIKKALYESAKNFPIPDVYIRLEDDVATLSIDTSGEALYKRGDKSHGGQAPLRENLAFSLLYAVSQELKEYSELTLLDPFAGSGTLLLEGNAFASGQDNSKRTFSYLGYPSFKPSEESMNFQNIKNPYRSFFGIERHSGQFSILSGNCKEIAKLEHGDSLVKNSFGDLKNLVIVTNPPYGDRIDDDFSIEQVYKKLIRTYGPMAMAFILPREKMSKKFSQEFRELFNFSHGGISVGLYFKSNIERTLSPLT